MSQAARSVAAAGHSQRGAPSSNGHARSYYGKPIVKRPAWTWEIPWYLFAGGLAGASSVLSAAARLTGHQRLARNATLAAGAGALASPALLISDLGRPERFYMMLRVFKPTSPMSMGTWILTVYGSTAVPAAAAELLGILPRLRAVLEAVSGVMGAPMVTYTGALVSDTVVPVWHEARRELPMLFAGSGAASAGAVATIFAPTQESLPARRMLVAGSVLELATDVVMERRLGDLARPYHEGTAGRFSTAAKVLTAAGAAVVGLLGNRRSAAVAGSALVLGGAICQRWAVFKAGFASVEDPAATVAPQRARVDGGERTRAPD